MEKIWYYTLDGSEKFGPYTDEELIKQIQQGIITENHYIWTMVLKTWCRVGDSIYAFYLPKKTENTETEAL